MIIVAPMEDGIVRIGAGSRSNDVSTLYQLTKREREIIRRIIISNKFPGVIMTLNIRFSRSLFSQCKLELAAQLLLRNFGSFGSLGSTIEDNGLDADFSVSAEMHRCEELGYGLIPICRRGDKEKKIKDILSCFYGEVDILLKERFKTDKIFQKYYRKK